MYIDLGMWMQLEKCEAMFSQRNEPNGEQLQPERAELLDPMTQSPPHIRFFWYFPGQHWLCSDKR